MSDDLIPIKPANRQLERGAYGPINHIEVELRSGGVRTAILLLPGAIGKKIEDLTKRIEEIEGDGPQEEKQRNDLSMLIGGLVEYFVDGDARETLDQRNFVALRTCIEAGFIAGQAASAGDSLDDCYIGNEYLEVFYWLIDGDKERWEKARESGLLPAWPTELEGGDQ